MPNGGIVLRIRNEIQFEENVQKGRGCFGGDAFSSLGHQQRIRDLNPPHRRHDRNRRRLQQLKQGFGLDTGLVFETPETVAEA
jgi:hypothetical protein